MRIRTIAVLQLALIFPAVLFFIALVLRSLGPRLYVAYIAQQLVMWYANRLWTLRVLLLALPFAVLVGGCAALRHMHRDIELQRSLALSRPHWPTLSISVVTVAAGGILGIVVLHVLKN